MQQFAPPVWDHVSGDSRADEDVAEVDTWLRNRQLDVGTTAVFYWPLFARNCLPQFPAPRDVGLQPKEYTKGAWLKEELGELPRVLERFGVKFGTARGLEGYRAWPSPHTGFECWLPPSGRLCPVLS